MLQLRECGKFKKSVNGFLRFKGLKCILSIFVKTAQENSPENATFQAWGGKKVGFFPPLYSKTDWLEDVRP